MINVHMMNHFVIKLENDRRTNRQTDSQTNVPRNVYTGIRVHTACVKVHKN